MNKPSFWKGFAIGAVITAIFALLWRIADQRKRSAGK